MVQFITFLVFFICLTFSQGKSRFREELNEWDLLSSEEFEREREGGTVPPAEEEEETRAFGGLIPANPAERYDLYSERAMQAMRQNRGALPSSYDARSQGLVSPVKNQKSCGSCASFSATAVIETCLYKTGGLTKHADLSEQWLLDCGKDGK